jgi:putative PIN family toxin of toxin-antitoxin system
MRIILMRIILDTNILLSALLSPHGPPAKLLDAWESKKFDLVACDALIVELREVAARPFFRARLRPGTAAMLADGLREFSLFFPKVPTGRAAPHFAPDPKDSYLLALAEVSHSDFLVTGDKELLTLGRQKLTRIVTASAMVQILSQA